MFNKDLMMYEATDASGNYDWIFENMDPADAAKMNEADIENWVEEVIDQCTEEEISRATIFVEDEQDLIEDLEDLIEKIKTDLLADRKYVAKEIREWIKNG